MDPALLTGLTIGGVTLVALIVRVVLFRLGCILADVNEPSLAKSILIVLVVAAVTGLGGWSIALALWTAEAALTSQAGLLVFPGLALYQALIVVAAGLLYSAMLAATFKKGLIVAGIEFLLSALLAALLTAGAMVVLASWQYGHRAEGPSGQGAEPAALVAERQAHLLR